MQLKGISRVAGQVKRLRTEFPHITPHVVRVTKYVAKRAYAPTGHDKIAFRR